MTYAHITNIEQLYGVKIERITAGSVPEVVLRYKRFPGGMARHCTSELKIIPSKKFYKAFAKEQGGFQVWLGMRSDESREREARYRGVLNTDLYPPHEVMGNFPKYLHKLGVSFRLPVLDFSTSEIFELLGDEANPLYKCGFSRVGCFPCLAAGDKTKEKAFGFDEFGVSQREVVRELETAIHRSVFTSKGGKLRNDDDRFTGCAMCAI
jgi:3'-phosphoadenosine 5'-phosphosulfate sulfotransferase (PAPS reductase)/FAD synthetase